MRTDLYERLPVDGVEDGGGEDEGEDWPVYERLPVDGVEDGGGEDEGEDCAQH